MSPTREIVRLNDETIRDGVSYLRRTDQTLGALLPNAPFLNYKTHRLNYSTFVNVVVNQQLSDQAADTIRRKIYALLNHEVTPTQFLGTSLRDLRKCGISNQKIQSLRSIATIIQLKPQYCSRLKKLTIGECIRELVALKGIGPWSASIIALFYIGHLDVLVEGDTTINKVLSKLYDVKIKKIGPQIHAMTKQWRPYRSVGCLVCWYLYDQGL